MSVMDRGVSRSERYFVFMNYDPEYERLRSNWKGVYELDMCVSKKHDDLLASILRPGNYRKTLSLVIVDGFAVEISEDQVNTQKLLSRKQPAYSSSPSAGLVFLDESLTYERKHYDEHTTLLRSSKGVRVVDKNQEVV